MRRFLLAAGLFIVVAGGVWFALPGARLEGIAPLEGMVKPGAAAHFRVTVSRPWYDFRPVTVSITAGVSDQPVATLKTKGGTVEWTTPATAGGGYGVTARLGKQQASTALDVGANWAAKPRYGFLTDFGKQDAGQASRFQTMAAFHINGIQFYDWMYRHSDYIPPTDEFKDPLKRDLYKPTIVDKLNLAHQFGMATMAYTAVYGAPKEFMEAHKDWALYDLAGRPMDFANGFLYIMNPEPGGPWSQHMVSEYTKIVTQLPFDGIHLDQYGDPKWGFRYPGGDGAVGVDVSQGIVSLINATKSATGKTVIFNDVNGWPLAQTAPTSNDAVYIEVWPPNVMFNNLGDLIDQGRRLSGGKPVVLAAYINPEYEPSVLLTDAVIFAKGGSHIELGEGGNMLADPYFPKYKPMSPALSQHLRHFYDVAVRYQDYLYAPDLRDWPAAVTVADTRMLTGGYFNGVWPVARENDRFATLSLINLNGLEDGRWNSARKTDPAVLSQRQVTVEMTAAPKALYLVDPDGADQAAQPVKFTYAGGKVTFTLDRLAYWSLLVFEK